MVEAGGVDRRGAASGDGGLVRQAAHGDVARRPVVHDELLAVDGRFEVGCASVPDFAAVCLDVDVHVGR